MSIRTKILLALLFLGLLPYGITGCFIFRYGENLLKENIKNQQIQNIELVKKNIEDYFSSISKNLLFWSKAQIMDDIVTGDMDKRIQIFLDQIKRNYRIKGDIFVVDKKGNVIASTREGSFGKSISKYIENKNISISFDIYASFHKEKIGKIIYTLSPENLKYFLFSSSIASLSVFDPKTNQNIGFIKNIPQKYNYENDKYLYIFEKFKEKPLKNWFLVSRINKNIAFFPLKKVENFFFLVFFSGFGLIVFLAFYLSKKLVNPMKKIANTMEDVVRTKNYSKRFFYHGDDEIAILSKAFNYMLSEIEKALNTIKEENRKRLELFSNLIEIFSKITTLQNEKEVLNVAVEELKKFFSDTKVSFLEKEKPFSVKIETEKVKGYLVFETKRKISEEEKKFFVSIGNLIGLLIEKVELLNKSQEASKAKSAFISNMSHELRTPLNSIIGFSQFLKMEEKDKTKKEALNSIETSGKHLLEIINDILEYAKIEAGAVKINKEKFNVKELFEEIKQIIKPLSDGKNLELVFPDRNIEVYTDKKLLKQVLINLLSNAVKFTEKGSIKVSVWTEGNKVFFSVKDTGIGIREEDIPKIFKNFTQLENPLQKKYKGTGLGLAITKEYVYLLGGEIKVKSEGIGKGSEFIFYIS
ncbi:ATP-binding protein [Persephonella sp.]|uniref:ATP-binding protein n=1 Tax=Persephonella sp. TaxID=2060922 RepID=UPI0026218A41|nr:ATP-binding protein [Persephonella sp.]